MTTSETLSEDERYDATMSLRDEVMEEGILHETISVGEQARLRDAIRMEVLYGLNLFRSDTDVFVKFENGELKVTLCGDAMARRALVTAEQMYPAVKFLYKEG